MELYNSNWREHFLLSDSNKALMKMTQDEPDYFFILLTLSLPHTSLTDRNNTWRR